MCFYADRFFHAERRLELAIRQMPARVHCTFQRHAQALRGGVKRHLSAVEAQRKAVRRLHLRKADEPVGPLNNTDIALDERHLQQLFHPLELVRRDERRTCQGNDGLFE
ncbi:hypothetical protein D9M71_826910 [compost metagenome]